MLEFAIVGSVALLALAFMIQIGLRMNYQQEIEQQTFRRAMQVAHSEDDEESRSIQYQHFRERQIPDPSEGFGIMPRTLTQAGATVIWGEYLTYLADDRDSESRIIFQVNADPPREFRSSDFEGANEDDPTIRQVDRITTSRGLSYQNNANSGIQTTTEQRTTLTLKTGAQVSSGVTKTTQIDF